MAIKAGAQQNISQLLAAGINDAQQFSGYYFKPVAEAAMHNMTNGWYATAEVKRPGKFKISLVGNGSFVKSEQQYFQMNTDDYENLEFADGSLVKEVATVLGQNDPDIVVVVPVDSPFGPQEQEITLPNGLGEFDVNVVPTVFLQGEIVVFKGTQLKARYFPKVNYDDVDATFYGGALQHEFTSWFPGSELFPFHVSGIVAYTHLSGNYDFTDNEIVEGENQVLKSRLDSWMAAAVVSTRWPFANLYAGVGYVTGTSQIDVTGTYRVQSGVLQNQTVVDPFSVEHEIGGLKANLGVNLNFSFFNLNADYSFQKYHNVSVGLGFGI